MLRSSDGIEFCIDSTVLRRASPIFRDMFGLCKDNSQSKPIIDMDESSKILNFILRSLYPTGPLPVPSGTAEAEAILRVVEKYDLSNYVIYEALKGHLASIAPLQAWAIAIRFKRDEDRRSAGKRWIVGDGRVEDSKELEMVSGRELARLIHLRQDIIGNIQSHLERMSGYWSCSRHDKSPYIQQHISLMLESPFSLAGFDYESLSEAVDETECSGCLGRFRNYKGVNARRAVGGYVDDLVEAAAEKV